MSAYADGELSAFETLVRGLEPRLKALLTQLSGSRSLAEDLMQETFLRIHRARGTFIRGNAVMPWAITIACNCFLSFTRARKNTRLFVAVQRWSEDLPADSNTDPSCVLCAGQVARIASDELARMPADHRQAFLLLKCDGLSVAAAAGVIGISEGALKLRAFRAYSALRRALVSHEVFA